MTLKFISYSDDWDVAIIYNAVQGPVAKMNFLTEKKFNDFIAACRASLAAYPKPYKIDLLVVPR